MTDKKLNIIMVICFTVIAYGLISSIGGLNPLKWVRKEWISFIVIDGVCSLYYLLTFKYE